MNPSFRRVVTGHNDQGRAIIISDGPPPSEFPLQAVPGLLFSEVWRTAQTPVPIDNSADPTSGPLQLAPASGGSTIRVVEMPPDSQHMIQAAAALFAELDAKEASTTTGDVSNALMHRTETVDYGIVVSGEIWLVLDEGETKLVPGDIVVQRGTNHAWSNRSEHPARMVFVLLDGSFSPEIANMS